MFTAARLKLTAWYALILTMVCLFLSGLFYVQISRIIQRDFDRVEVRLQRDFPRPHLIPLSQSVQERILQADYKQIRRTILARLLFLNAGVVGFTTILSYILAGVTLRPLEENHQRQKQFVSDAAHDLRTPLASLHTTLEANLLDSKLSKNCHTVFQENLEDVQRLERLVEGLLQSARGEQERLVLEVVDLKEVLNTVVKTMQPLAQKKGIDLELQVPEAPLRCLGNSDALTTVFQSLLDNSLKYSLSKASPISIQAQTKKNRAEVRIVDHGRGIAKKDLAYVFERFRRTDNSRSTQHEPGYGLGLTIVRDLLKRQNGSVRLESDGKTGTVSTVRLPAIA